MLKGGPDEIQKVHSRSKARWLIAACWFALSLHPCSAETLREALELAYRANPTLNAQRANLGATAAPRVGSAAGRVIFATQEAGPALAGEQLAPWSVLWLLESGA